MTDSLPDTVAWAADFLRGKGWTVVAPVDPGAAIPDVAVGQVWASPKPRVQDRIVVRIGPRRVNDDPRSVQFVDPASNARGARPSVMTPQAWRAWVRKSNARPLPTPTDGAAP